MVKQSDLKKDSQDVYNANENVQDLDKIWDFSGKERIQKEIEEAKREPTLMERKIARIFGGVGNAGKMFQQGFKLGATVGGIFGGIIGTFYAISSRQFLILPMSMIGTGCSFGFFMGIGMILRTQMEQKDGEEEEVFKVVKIIKNPETGAIEFSEEPIYKQMIY
ncbi:unnamed protein product [Moneuplotes crassus]|uniref:Reactive oxygen species modulator 1 n=1 Tax=Euplotes crassus TaxID=5936 RepID=A0AAD2D763_EUPCR|nr:unnamed protein product [Moneuplotes crassus]